MIKTAVYLMTLVCLMSVLAVPCKAVPADTNLAWKAGVASIVITPKTNMWMAGYAARKKPSDGIAQDLFAKALALEDSTGTRLVIVTTDLIGIQQSVRESVEKQVGERHKLLPAYLLLNASHTHCGPEYRARSGREKEANDYQTFLEEQLVQIIGKALSNLQPAKLQYAHARCGFAMNRRRNYSLPAEDPNSKKAPNPDGPVDHEVPVLMVQGTNASLSAVLFGYACHNTTLSAVSTNNNMPRYEFTGDYAGYAQETLQSGRPGLTAMFLSGCGADQNPYPRHFMVSYVKPLEFAQHHGRTLAYAVEAAMASHVRPVYGPVRAALEYVTLKREEKDKEKDTSSCLYPVQVIRFGEDLTLVALGSEVVVDYSLRLKRDMTGKASIWVAGYSNYYAGYIPSLRVLKEGGYEAPNYKPEIEDRIVSKVHELHDRLNKSREL